MRTSEVNEGAGILRGRRGLVKRRKRGRKGGGVGIAWG